MTRDQRWVACNQGARFCQKRHGASTCGGQLEDTMLPGGAMVLECPRCLRFRAGRCRDCPGKRAGQSPRCRTCQRAAKLKRHRRLNHRPDYREKAAARRRRQYRDDPAVREQRKAEARAYHHAHSAAAARRARYHRDPDYRAHTLAVRRAWYHRTGGAAGRVARRRAP